MGTRVVLGEDNAIAREALLGLLAEMGDVQVVATAEDLPALRAAVQNTEPDLVVTDLRMPPTHTDEGLRFAAEVRDSAPGLSVLVISVTSDVLYPAALFERGAAGRGYMAKEQLRDLDAFAEAVRAVAAGESYLHRSLLEQLNLNPEQALSRLQQLTDT